MKFYFFYFALLSFVLTGFSQEVEADSTSTKTLTIVDNYNEIIDKSGSYQEYKVIKKTELADFRIQLTERKNAFESEISSLENEITNQAKEIKELKQQLETTQNSLAKVEEEKDSMQFFGNNLNKALYQTIVFGIIGVLILILVVLLVKFKSNASATKDAKEILSRTEKDFEDYKRNALEKQQKLGRQLQDEKNKVSKLKTGGKK
ncbi:hypothetical protein [Psychroflexus planctonicus]|nr:hypothetical protein [Psychroflexus planctonicus]